MMENFKIAHPLILGSVLLLALLSWVVSLCLQPRAQAHLDQIGQNNRPFARRRRNRQGRSAWPRSRCATWSSGRRPKSEVAPAARSMRDSTRCLAFGTCGKPRTVRRTTKPWVRSRRPTLSVRSAIERVRDLLQSGRNEEVLPRPRRTLSAPAQVRSSAPPTR